MDFTTNYCGPYWSNGRFQSSVVGDVAPVSALDTSCWQHDADYARAKTIDDFIAADNNFYYSTRSQGLRGQLYGDLVLYGNRTVRGGMAFFAPFLAGIYASAGVGAAISSNLLPKSKPRLRSVTPIGDAVTQMGQPPSDGGVPGDIAPGPSSETIADNYQTPFTTTGLYRPLGRRRLKLKIKKQKQKLNKIMPSPENKTKTKHVPSKQEQRDKHAKDAEKVAQAHIDQASCKNHELRSCVNYQYCTRCNREFRPRFRASR